MKTVEITDTKLLKHLNDKHEVSLKNEKLLKEMEELSKLETDFKTNISKMARMEERARPLIVKVAQKVKLTEYEELSRVYKKGSAWIMEFADRMEEFKIHFKNLKK